MDFRYDIGTTVEYGATVVSLWQTLITGAGMDYPVPHTVAMTNYVPFYTFMYTGEVYI